jgi:CHAT domain-containing protein
MKTKCLLGLGLLILAGTFNSSNAQIGKKFKDKLKKAQTALDNPSDFVRSEGVNVLKKSKAKMDSASFGYAIALRDNAGLFENKEIVNDVQDGAILLFEKNTEKEPVDVAVNYKDAGEMSYAANKYRAAEVSFLASRIIFETNYLETNINYPGVIADLGLLNHTMGRYGLAMDYTNEALEKREALLGDDSDAYAASLNNLAVLQKDMGLYSEAEKTQNRALEITGANSDETLAYAILLNNKAMLSQTLGRYDEAMELLNQSIAISESSQGSKSSNHQRLLTNLAILYQEKGNYDKAEETFMHVIELKEKRLGKSHPDYAHMLSNLAALYVVMGKDDQVIELLTSAKEIYEDKLGVNHPSYASNMSHLGNFYRYKQNYEESEKSLQQVLFIREQVLGKTHPDYASTLEDLALLYWESGQLLDAYKYFQETLELSFSFIEDFFPAMSESEKSRYWGKMQPRFFRYFAFATQYVDQEPIISKELFEYRIATKALLLSSSTRIRKTILASGNQELIDKYLEWTDLKESLSAYYSFSKKELVEQKINLDSLEREVNNKEKFLSENSEVFKEGYFIKAPEFEEIKSMLSAEEAGVEIIQIPVFERTLTSDSEYYALIVTTETEYPALVRLNSSSELDDKYFKYYRNSIQLKRADEYSFEKFWAPIVPNIRNKNHIYISNDGIYNQVNINTLKGAGNYVVDDINVSLLTNLSALLEGSKEVGEGGNTSEVFLLGFPDYGESDEILPLPGTEKEIEDINDVLTNSKFKTTLVTGNEATEEAVKDLKDPGLVHIATHGFFMPDIGISDDSPVFGIEPSAAREKPMLRSGVLLKGAAYTFHGVDHKEISNENNGVLTAYEVMNLDFDQTSLVVLSACETGLGDMKTGEGVYGLQRAFLVAGADALIMSLWKVNDEATQKLMTSFYRNLSTSSDYKQAFKKAQLALKKEYSDPYFWGAFVMIEH